MSTSASLSDKPGVFGQFSQCLAFGPPVQDVGNHSSSQPTLVPRGTVTLNDTHDVYHHLQRIEEKKPEICILAFLNVDSTKNGKLPLPLPKEMFERIAKDFNLSPEFLTVHGTGLATFTSTSASGTLPDGSEKEYQQLVIQQNRAYSAISMAITFCEATGQSRILIIGVDKPFLLELYSHLEKTSQLTWPLDIPAIAMELQARALTASVQSCQDRIRAIETLTGMRQSIHPHERNDSGAQDQDWKSLDLVDITRDLSSLLSRSAFIRMQADTGAYLLRQMARTLEAWPGRSVEVHSQDTSGHQYDLLSKLRHIESWLLGLDARCRYLSERTAAQSQTVYCLISSKDTSTGIDIARSSQKIAEQSHSIAELSRRDNELMLQIAKDSREVAVSTAKDSASMQVIAAITVIFLPATFTATFFSTTFFDFLSSDQPQVSRWCWIYFVVTAVLTAAIYINWTYVSRKKQAGIADGTPLRPWVSG